MNIKMFKKIINQTSFQIDFTNFPKLVENTIKIIKKEDTYYAFNIDNKLNKKLIIETQSEDKLYKGILKYLKIKLNHHGKVINKDVPIRK